MGEGTGEEGQGGGGQGEQGTAGRAEGPFQSHRTASCGGWAFL